ncbi:hypothetical protein J8385_19570, partial [Acinetobacter baumannii]|nr:hypothetical protein [Acinetobacter baumannii]
FTTLVVRLSHLQINQHEEFVKIVEKGQKNIVEENAPRGYIYDSKGTVLVGNKANQAILYTRSVGMSANEIKEVSKSIASLINIEPEKLSDRDKADFILSNPEELKKAESKLKVSDKLNAKGEQLSQGELYSKMVEKVEPEKLNLSEEDQKIATVFKKINAGTTLQPITIKNRNVSP